MNGRSISRAGLLAVGLLAAATTIGLAAKLSERDVATMAEYELRTLDGEPVRLASEGEVVVVNFWASWCKPCRKEMPFLHDLHQKLSRSGGRVVAVSIDRDERKAVEFAREHGLDLPMCHDGPDGLVRALDLDAIPYTVVLDGTGRAVYASGGSGDDALVALQRAVDGALATRVASRDTEGEDVR
jgi:thiol-disulfide isomerase/thioredoxin